MYLARPNFSLLPPTHPEPGAVEVFCSDKRKPQRPQPGCAQPHDKASEGTRQTRSDKRKANNQATTRKRRDNRKGNTQGAVRLPQPLSQGRGCPCSKNKALAAKAACLLILLPRSCRQLATGNAHGHARLKRRKPSALQTHNLARAHTNLARSAATRTKGTEPLVSATGRV